MIGIDIVEIRRIAAAIRNRRFVMRVFHPAEIAYCESRKNRAQHYAARFAAKEAVWKALEGRRALALRDIVVEPSENGKPEIRLPASACTRLRVEVSLSHTATYAAAVALVSRSRNRRHA